VMIMHDDEPTTSPKHPGLASAFDRLVDSNLEMAASVREFTASVQAYTASVQDFTHEVRALLRALSEGKTP